MTEQRLISIIPNPEDALALEPEELAGAILQWLNSCDFRSAFKLAICLGNVLKDYPERYRERLMQAGLEAAWWLIREGLILPTADNSIHYFITRRGKQLASAADVSSYRNADILPRKILHPLIAQRVFATFLRGDYDTAVFQAFKDVEVRVRGAGGFTNQEFGVALMRKAFDPNQGPLRDQNAIPGERQAMSDLFAGAIGSCKNPHSHQNVAVTADVAVELLMLASHLLRLVDERVPPTV